MSNILEFHAHISNHYEKCIQVSKNMSGIGLGIREIAFESLKMLTKQDRFGMVKQ